MSIIEFDGPPSWSLDVSKTEESTKYPWVGVVEGTVGEKNRETATATLCVMVPPLIKSINNLLPWRGKNPVKSGNLDINYTMLCSCE